MDSGFRRNDVGRKFPQLSVRPEQRRRACISHGSDPRVWLTPEWVVRQAHHDRYLGIGGLNKIGLVSEQLVYFPLSLFFSAAAGALDGLVEARAVFTDADDHWQRQCVAEYQGLLFGFQAGEH